MSADLFCQFRKYWHESLTCLHVRYQTHDHLQYVSLVLICMMHAPRACNVHVRLKRLLQTARVHHGCLVASRDAMLDCTKRIYVHDAGYHDSHYHVFRYPHVDTRLLSPTELFG